MLLRPRRELHGPIQLRPAAALFPEPLPEKYTFLADVSFDKQICIRHPAYDDGDDILLILPAQDHADGGLHYGLVMTACHIISNNQEGSLTTSRAGSPIQADMDDVLRAGDYYYYVPPLSIESSLESVEPNRWPVVNSFLDWTFPAQMPASWTRPLPFQTARSAGSQSALSTFIKARDISCRISSHETGLELAHLCPRNEIDWFARNHMYRWNAVQGLDGDNLTNDSSNVLLLRADLHKSFDQRHFIFFPKCADSYVIHMLSRTPDIGQLYHNVRLAPILQCNPRFLYTRFAWAIFPLLSGFLSAPGIRRVVRIDNAGKSIVEDDAQPSKRRERAAEARRDQSPKKRSRNAFSTGNNEVDDEVVYNDAANAYVEAAVEADSRSCKKRRRDRDKTSAPSPPLNASAEPIDPELLSSASDPEQYDGPNEPPSWYPGWENTQAFKELYLRKHTNVRPEGYVPSPPGRLPIDGAADVKDALRDMGVEILEDDDT